MIAQEVTEANDKIKIIESFEKVPIIKPIKEEI